MPQDKLYVVETVRKPTRTELLYLFLAHSVVNYKKTFVNQLGFVIRFCDRGIALLGITALVTLLLPVVIVTAGITACTNAVFYVKNKHSLGVTLQNPTPTQAV